MIECRRKMSAYVLAQIQINDPDEYSNYLAGFMPIFERHGGEFLATLKNKPLLLKEVGLIQVR